MAKIIKMNKRITDLTDEEIKDFFRSLNDDHKVISISRNKTWDEITCQIRSGCRITFDSDIMYATSELILTDPEYWEQDEESLYYQYGADAVKQWKQFCFAKGIIPDWLLNNPYTEAHVVQLTDEQLELVIQSLDDISRNTKDFVPEYSSKILKVAMEIARQEREQGNGKTN